MQNSQFTQGQMDFKQSQISEYSKYDFDVKSQPFQVDESINKSIIDRCVSQKQFSNTPEVSKKLYLNDLQTHKENSNDSKFSTKQNNISVNHHNQPQSYTQSRKIVLQRNPYKNFNVDESFTTSKIVQLQQELLEVRKQLGMKQSSWIKEKSILLNKIQIAQYDLAQIKQRNNNLIQINQTLTQALGETSKQSSSNENDKRIDELNREIQSKSRKIQSLQDNLSRNEKDKMDFQSKLKEQREKNESLSKNLQEYKTILKQSNQRKFESDEKIMVMNKNIDIVKKKLTQLPIKESYLHPVFAFLQSMKSLHFQSHITQESSYLEISDVKKPTEDRSFIGQKNKYKQQSSFVQMMKPSNYYGNGNDNSYLPQNSDCYDNQESYGDRESDYMVECNKNTSQFMKPKKSNSRLNLFSKQVKRIDTQENQQEESNTGQYQDEEQVFLCEICQRVYPHEQFMGHLQQCQQYEALLKQKRAIQSKLISIKQQQYDNRKSNTTSLNNSVILMNKSRSKGKFIKPSENGHRIDKGYNREFNQRKLSNNNNGNKTERYLHHQQMNDGSRLELSELMNISEISNRHSNVNQKGNDKKAKKSFINSNNYFSNGVQNQENFNYQYNQEKLNYKLKPSPQIKYQTNIAQQQRDNIGKESMQEEIRRIVQAMNEGRKSVSKQNGGFQKMNNKQHLNENRSLTSRNNGQKSDRRESNLGGRNYDRTSRNKADFY